jgi:hypothetical protein
MSNSYGHKMRTGGQTQFLSYNSILCALCEERLYQGGPGLLFSRAKITFHVGPKSQEIPPGTSFEDQYPEFFIVNSIYSEMTDFNITVQSRISEAMWTEATTDNRKLG